MTDPKILPIKYPRLLSAEILVGQNIVHVSEILSTVIVN